MFENESFNVEFVYSDEVRKSPDFDVLLEDFQILANTRSSNLLSVNGRFSYEHSYRLTLMPRRTGQLVLPPITFDGVQSEPIAITVKPSPVSDGLTSLGDLHLEVTLEPERGYVQGQFILTQRLYHLGWLASGKLSEPKFGDSDTVVRQVEQAKRYTMYRDGQRYQIYEQSYLVFPQSSGTLTAEAIDFTGQLREPGRAPRLKRVSAPAVSVEVMGVPAAASSETFLPASRLTLEEEWPTDVTFTEGQPVTRVLRVTVDGQMAAQLQEIALPDVEDLRVYADQPKRDDVFAQTGVTGTIEQSLALVPQRPGPLTLPAVRVSWWDVTSDTARVAEIPERVIEVAPGVAAGSPLTSAPRAGPGAKAASVDPVSDDLADASANAADPAASRPWPYWPLLAGAFAVLWLATLAGWANGWLRERAVKEPGAERAVTLDKRRLFSRRNAVKRACDDGDPVAATRALLDWAQLIWPDAPPSTLKAIAMRVASPTQGEILRLAATRYGTTAHWPEPDRLWRAIAHLKPQRARGEHRQVRELAAL